MKRLILVVFIVLFLVPSLTLAKKEVFSGQQLRITAPPPICEILGNISFAKCKANPRISKFGCSEIEPPPIYWGGLKPYRPMAKCLNRFRGGDFIRTRGCKAVTRERLIVMDGLEKKSKLFLINNKEEFRSFFAPINDPREAISYVAALTGDYPIYSFPKKYFMSTPEERGEYIKKNLKPTEVVLDKKGYHVRLFDKTGCGCNRPTLFAVEYLVTLDGYIQEESRKPVWQAHRLYEICLD